GFEASGTGNMKLAVNGSLTIGTQDGANIEMRESITDEWWPFSFGCTVEDIRTIKEEQSHDPYNFYFKHEKIKEAVDMLKDRSLSQNDYEHNVLSDLFNTLLSSYYEGRFFILKDLLSFYETQKKVEELYTDKYKWTQFAINNISAMGRFSSDEVINNYAKSIWQIDPCPLAPDIFRSVSKEYNEIMNYHISQK
ncbi:MAG: glycogen phosphorylase, partial [uncultured bacterium]